MSIKNYLKHLFIGFYYLLTLILYILALPIILLLILKPKFRESIPKRFFLYKNKFQDCDLWIHACSFGEVNALKPFLKPDTMITTITKTGQDQAKKLVDKTAYLPYEIFLPFWMKKAKTLVILEAEFWLMLVFVAKLKGTKVILLNSRISSKSYPNYYKFRFFYKIIFSYVDKIFAQSEDDKTRLLSLGAKNVEITGNIKTITNIKTTKTYQKPKQETITLASTHKYEEQFILEALNITNQKIIVVPRHPERFDEVYDYLQKFASTKELSLHRFSQQADFDSDIVLVDALGELINIYAITDITILGGSFVDGVGGHNPLEPATFGNKIISGEYIFNQQSLYPLVKNIKFSTPSNLNYTIKQAINTYITHKANISKIIL